MRSSVLKIIIVLFLFNIIFPLKTQAVTIPPPTSWTTFQEVIDAIINFIFYVGVAIFPIMAIVAGFLLLSSGGDPSKVKKAKDILLYSIIGLLIVLLARGLISVIKSILGAS
jgi:hypothetical protein